MDCTYSPYTLPTIDFVGGETQEFSFNTYFHSKDKPVSMEGYDCNFSVVSYTNKFGKCIISKQMSVVSGSDNGVAKNALCVKLDPADTRDWFGKYIYQISIKGNDGYVEIPKQGIMYVTNNINKSFLD